MTRELLFNDGEALDPADENNAQRLMRRLFMDEFVKPRYVDQGAVIGQLLRTFVGAFEARGDGATMDVELVHGFATWNQAADPGQPDYRLLPHYFEGDTVTINAADAANPRWDILSVKIEMVDDDVADEETRDFEDATTHALSSQTFCKRRKTKSTIAYTAGTPAASPSEPAVPAGYIKVARIEVPALATFIRQQDVVDVRRPGGLTVHHVPLDNWFGDGTFNTYAIGEIAANAGAQVTRFPLGVPLMMGRARLKQIRLNAKITTGSGGKVEIQAVQSMNVGSGVLTVEDVSAQVTDGVHGIYTITISETGAQGAIWSSGGRTPSEPYAAGAETLALKVTSGANGDVIQGVEVTYFGD